MNQWWKNLFNVTAVLQAFIIFLCAWDAAATQYIINHGLTDEGNPLMNSVIAVHGWTQLWIIKLGLSIIFAYALPLLIESWWGKGLISVVYMAYCFVAFLHLFMLTYFNFPA